MRDTFLCQPSFSFMTHSMKRHGPTTSVHNYRWTPAAKNRGLFLYIKQVKINHLYILVKLCTDLYNLYQHFTAMFSHVKPSTTLHSLVAALYDYVQHWTAWSRIQRKYGFHRGFMQKISNISLYSFSNLFVIGVKP